MNKQGDGSGLSVPPTWYHMAQGVALRRTRFLIGIRWVIRVGCPPTLQRHISYSRLTTNDPARFSAGLVCFRVHIPASPLLIPTQFLWGQSLKTPRPRIFPCSISTRFSSTCAVASATCVCVGVRACVRFHSMYSGIPNAPVLLYYQMCLG